MTKPAGQSPNDDIELVDTPEDQTELAEEEVELSEPAPGSTADEDLEEIDDIEEEAAPETPDTSLTALQKDLAAAEARALRAYADLDNYKKRFDREIARQRDTEREKFLNSILTIADNLRRALNVDNTDASPYREGLLTVMRHIENILKEFGVEPIPAEKGQPMDANVHEAITALTIPGAEHESIIEVVEPGYKMGERVLRPAKVVVARSEE